MTLIYQISLHGSAYDARDKTWDQMYSETGCKPRTGWLDPILDRPLLKGEFGCSVSHYRVWQKIAESNLNGLILEEDAVFDEINPNHVEWVLEDHDSAWLGYRWNSLGYWYNCHAYAITPDTAKLLIEDFHNNIIPVDEWIPHKLKDANNYFYPKEVVTQIPRSTRPSTIEDTDTMKAEFNMSVFTVATDESKMKVLSKSAEAHGVTVYNLGKGSDWYDPMEGHAGMPKLKMVREALLGLPEDDVVLFMDGYDTFFIKTPQEILSRFLDFNVDILFGAENNFWPPSQELQGQFDSKFSREYYKYLNSGQYIGRAGALRNFFSRAGWLYDKEVEGLDDQEYCQTEFLRTTLNVALDHEAYIFQNDDPAVTKSGVELIGPICAPCTYHGNGGEQAKIRFSQLASQFGYCKPVQSAPILSLSYNEVADDILVTELLTESECKDLIRRSEELGSWSSMEGDKFPAQEIRLKQLGLWKDYQKLWEDKLAKICEKHWKPLQYMGLRDAFTMRYAMDTQTSLGFHTDASLVTGSVKLNDDYEGATLHFPRQKFTNLDVPVGSCILFPAQVTHGHYVDELQSGVKYSLTMWTSRYEGDEN